MISILQDVSNYHQICIRDLIETDKEVLRPFLPATRAMKITLLATTVRYLDLLVARYGSLEQAIAAGESGEAFIAQAVRGRDNQHGGMVGWVKRFFPGAAFSNPKVVEARNVLEAMGIIVHESNGRGNVGFTRINVMRLMVLQILLEDELGYATQTEDDDNELDPPELDAMGRVSPYARLKKKIRNREAAKAARAENPDIEAAPPMARINKERWQSVFGFNPRVKSPDYQYPADIEDFLQEAWGQIATIAQPLRGIPQRLWNETEQFCIKRFEQYYKASKDAVKKVWAIIEPYESDGLDEIPFD
jgi:hypothetical protein